MPETETRPERSLPSGHLRIWATHRRASSSPRPALLLDRDGVVNVDHGYVHRVSDVSFLPGLFPLCRLAQDSGYALVVVTNQSGIGRGFFDADAFRDLSRWMIDAFAREGVALEAIYACPHAPAVGCSCRKPEPGMIRAAADDLGLDLAASVLVGDAERDVEAARRAGVGRAIRLGAPPFTTLDAVAADLRERHRTERPGTRRDT